MDESNQQSADGQNNILDVNRLISAQNLKFDHLTEVLRNTLNAFGQDLGRHLGELINNKPNNSDRDSTTEPPAKRQKVQASTYQYDADQSTGPHDPEHDGPLPASQGRPEDPSGNRSDTTPSDEPEDPNGNRPSEARWWKGPTAAKGKDPKGKRYVGPALAGPVPPYRKSETYNYGYDDSDRVSIHASNEESPPEQETDDMHSIIYKSSKISNAEQADDCQVPQLFTALVKETKKANAVNEKLAMSLGKVWNRQQSNEKINHILDKQLIPENCMFLQIPKVDPEIFASIPQQAKGHDVKLQRQQTMLVKAAVPITQLINKLMQIKVDQQMSEELLVSLKESASEAFAILSHADSKMLQMRRDDIVPHLAKEFKQLRNDVQKGSEYLFGDNVTERIASITRANKATRALTACSTAKQSSSSNWSKPNKRRLNYAESKGSKNLKSFLKQKGSAGKRSFSGQQSQYKGYQRWSHQE